MLFRSRCALAVLAAVAALGCDGGRYDVTVRFADPSRADDAVRVEVALVPSCDAQALGEPAPDAVARIELRRMEAAAPLGEVEPGDYGLYGRAISADCRVIGAGCTPVTVEAGGSGTLTVELADHDAAACAASESCAAGECGVGDGGAPEDGGRLDGGGDGGACSCPACADCEADGCVPVHSRCDADERCDVASGCVAAEACADTSPRCPDDGDPCTVERCDESGADPICVVDPAPSDTTCDTGGRSGLCRAGSCCTGCWDGSACVGGDTLAACGGGGGACADCDDGEPCTDDACTTSGCLNPANDTNTCSGGSCHGGACCTGCWDGSSCQAGTDPAACGADGGACDSCACPTPSCTSGACGAGPAVTAVGASSWATCAVSGGRLFCWGDNTQAALGQGDFGAGTERLVPTRVGAAVDWTSVAGGDFHMCGTRGATLMCWGSNGDGQLGLGDLLIRTGPTMVAGTTWASVTAADDRTCAFDAAGDAYCWGENNNGELGLGDTTERESPTPLPPPSGATSWSVLALGYESTCGIDSTARLFCWGENNEGQLGNGTADTTGTPHPDPIEIGTGTAWAHVCAGEGHGCAVDTGGGLHCWGANHDGMLGTGDTLDDFTPQRVGTATDWATVYCGEDHTCGLTTGGALFCWGENVYGQLGTGSVATHVTSPAQVGTASDWTAVALGEDHTCGVRGAGSLYCWGRSGFDDPATGGGQTGQGDLLSRDVPAFVCLP